MDSIALVEDLLDLELDEEGWETDVWGLGTIGNQDEVEAEQTDNLEWKHGVFLHVDADGRVQRPYIKRTEPRIQGTVVLRSVIVLIDYTEALLTSDAFKSNSPHIELLGLIHEFVDAFFELCPLGELGIVVVYNKVASAMCTLTSSPQTLHDTINEYIHDQTPSGRMSLQNGLEKCLLLLSTAKPYSTKEIVCVWNSTSTHDAGLIDDTIAVLASKKIRIGIISLKPSMYVLNKLAEACHGTYSVVRNSTALKDVLVAFTKAQADTHGDFHAKPAELIDVGFPELEQSMCAALCTCHNRLKFTGYTCPRCLARNCSIPSSCSVCGLLLVMSLDIARCAKTSYEVPPFQPLPRGSKECYVCERTIRSGAGMCLQCHHVFCIDCDVLIHEQLLPCPGCQYTDLLERQGLHVAKIPPEPPLPADHPQERFYRQQMELLGRGE